jgi:hypothetical protein
MAPITGADNDGTTETMEQEISQMRSMPWLGLSTTAILLLLCCYGCGGTGNGSTPAPVTPAPLSAANINLIFVVSEDSTTTTGDVNPDTANLTDRGLQRSLLMAPFLQQNVLGGENVSGIYALEPTTHIQAGTSGTFPDIVPLEIIEQFSMLNQTTMSYDNQSFTANSYPVLASYSAGSIPAGVEPGTLCAACQGLDFKDQQSDNEILVSGIVQADVPGFYVFAAPWETASVLLDHINTLEGYSLTLPTTYQGPNYIYALSIAPSERSARLITYNSDVNPPSTYPVLPPPAIVPTPCATPAFSIAAAAASETNLGGLNKSETVYMIRHAEAHPVDFFEDGNYVAAGEWRALDLPNALRGKLNPIPTQVYSIDPAIGYAASGPVGNLSYVRPALTAEPYAIANNLPFNLAASIDVFSQNAPALATLATNFFFTGGTFSNQTLLVAWEHDHIPPTINALLNTYNIGPIAPDWPPNDYDTIWTVTLDGVGNLSVNNALCEGINSATLPATAPQF